MNTVSLCYFLNSLYFVQMVVHDIVVNTTVNPTWSSLVFIIPVQEPQDYYWKVCRNFSQIFCLQFFYTSEEIENPAYVAQVNMDVTNANLMYHVYWLEDFVQSELKDVFDSKYKQINNFVDGYGCCVNQYFDYFTVGLLEMMLTPEEYYGKMSDFTDENKELNEIWAYYLPSCQQNIITKVGYGIGELRRHNHYFSLPPQEEGLPYMLKVDNSWSPPIPYSNPGDFLTFRWFKKNVMCLEQNWICEQFE